jgi:PAS domain S-box-containing protein
MEHSLQTTPVLNILSLEDSALDFEIISELLKDAGFKYTIERVETEKSFISSLNEKKYDIILADFNLPGYNAYDALQASLTINPDIPVIIVSGSIGEIAAIELIKQGATDYVLKDKPDRLPLAVQRALEEAKEKEARKQAEEALKKNEAIYRTLTENIPDIIARFDRNLKHLYVNPIIEKITGVPVVTYFGKTNEELGMPFANLAIWNENMHQVFETASPRKYEFSFLTKDGIHHYLTEAVPEFSEDGKVITILTVTRDITDIKKAEAEIKLLNEDLERRVDIRTAQLEAANKDLESFSYSISHDLRTPLRALNGFANILLDEYSPVLDIEGLRLLGVIIENANKMGLLIDDLLSFSRLGRIEIQKVPIDMYAMAMSVYQELIVNEPDPKVDFRLGEIAKSYGDPSMVRQVWFNILSNAIKYTSKNTSRIIEISSYTDDGETIYKIKDNGAGFDMAGYEKLFGVFQRLHVSKEFDGIGIGLAIVNRIVSRHSGRVWAEGKVGQGATFYFSLGRHQNLEP